MKMQEITSQDVRAWLVRMEEQDVGLRRRENLRSLAREPRCAPVIQTADPLVVDSLTV
jgi:hypothetical protein